MNLILIDESSLLNETHARITGRALAHAQSVLRVAPGEKIRVGVIGQRMGEASVVTSATDAMEIKFESWADPPPPLRFQLFIAMPRPKVLLRVLQTASCLGIKTIHLVNSYRVEKSFWHCEQLKPERIDLSLRLGLEQARDTILPQVYLHRRLKPFVEDSVPSLIVNQTALIAHPIASRACPSLPSTDISLAIGPEGGFIPYEVDLFTNAGFSAIHLGPRILKVEAALTALATRLCFTP